jgi:hypothetical protein
VYCFEVGRSVVSRGKNPDGEKRVRSMSVGPLFSVGKTRSGGGGRETWRVGGRAIEFSLDELRKRSNIVVERTGGKLVSGT